MFILRSIKKLFSRFTFYYKLYGAKKTIAAISKKISFIIKPEREILKTKKKKKWKKKNILNNLCEISVVIPTYNRAKILPSLLESWRKVDKVTQWRYEIIFSDDGSLDNSVEILSEVNDIPLKVISNIHGGASKARNKALEYASGEKILFLGDDIFPDPEIINFHMEKLTRLEETIAVLGEVVWHPDLEKSYLMDHITEAGNEQFSFNRLKPNSLTDFRHFYTCNISLDREFLLSEPHFFSEDFYKVNFEDIELGYRLALKGMKIYYYPNAKGYHFHPYTIVQFLKRQKTAGEMAIVFRNLHPELSSLLGIEQILEKFNAKGETPFGVNESDDYFSKVVNFCSMIEFLLKKDLEEGIKLRKELSDIYSTIFSFYFELGVITKAHPVYRLDKFRLFRKGFDLFRFYLAFDNLEDIVKSFPSQIKESLNKSYLEEGNINKDRDLEGKNLFQTISILKNSIRVYGFKCDIKSRKKMLGIICSQGYAEKFSEKYFKFKSEVDICSVKDSFNEDIKYLYYPESVEQSFSINELENIILCLTFHDLDFLLISNSNNYFPKVSISSVFNCCVIKKDIDKDLFLKTSGNLIGKVINLLPEKEEQHFVDISKIFSQDIKVKEEYITLN